MTDVMGVDSRIFIRKYPKRDGTQGHFNSVLGIAVKVRDYVSFDKKYSQALNDAFKEQGLTPDYKYYCTHDLQNMPDKIKIIDAFIAKISESIDKVHIFYTLFSRKHIERPSVYGRFAKRQKIKLANSTRTYDELITAHLAQCFPIICAWRLMDYFNPENIQFHLDSYEGHICEAYEDFEQKGYKTLVYPRGDRSNATISTADLLLDALDRRLYSGHKYLLFDNIRPSLVEFGEKVLVYPISNKHLRKITPIDKVGMDALSKIKHPVFWLFKAEELIDYQTMKNSKAFRNLLDYAAGLGGTVKIFDIAKDIDYVKKGDFGVYHNTRGKELIDSYKSLGKDFKPFKFDYMVSTDTQRGL